MIDSLRILDKGFVTFKSILDGDMGVVEAARVSYKSDIQKTDEENKKLIAYLLKHHHGTPFEHAVLKFHVKCPLFVARQWFRHRMASYNETSFRYREAPEEFYFPDRWRVQDKKNKQGSLTSELPMNIEADASQLLHENCMLSMESYRALLKENVSREMARMLLPVNLYTEFYLTVNARSLMNFISLRSDDHAQWEMRQYSHALAAFFACKMPWTWEAFSADINKNGGYDEMFKTLWDTYDIKRA